MEKSKVKATLTAQGWVEDRFGNLISKSKLVRVKLQASSLRVERKIPASVCPWGSKIAAQWVNQVSDYYKNLSVKGDLVCIKGLTIRPQA